MFQMLRIMLRDFTLEEGYVHSREDNSVILQGAVL